MNFEQLIYVKSVYEQESMIRASELMHISQSAMSQSIANRNRIRIFIILSLEKGQYRQKLAND